MKTFVTIFGLLFSGIAFPMTQVEGISFSKKEGFFYFDINYAEGIPSNTKISFRSNMIQLSMDKTSAWPKIEKTIDLGEKYRRATLTAYQFDKKTSRFRITLQEGISLNSKFVSLQESENRHRIAWKIESPMLSHTESYLDKLVKEEEENLKNVDQVSITSSSVKKESFNEYLVRYFSIVCLFIGGVWLLLTFFRKKIMKRGILGLTGEGNQIEKISSTHLAPKTGLHLVKVGGEIFLLGATDHQVGLISKIQGKTQVLKEAEKILTGENFEKVLEKRPPKKFKMKENIEESNNEHFVSELRRKIKGLKSFQ